MKSNEPELYTDFDVCLKEISDEEVKILIPLLLDKLKMKFTYFNVKHDDNTVEKIYELKEEVDE